jgi:D-glycero-alpha-D-manno-heptose-7-phosphate kinase
VIVHARAPLRLGLAGGGSDVSPYAEIYGGQVMNVTLDRYAYAEIKANNMGEVAFHSTDFGLSESDSVGSVFSSNSKLPLHNAVYKRVMNDFNDSVFESVELTTFSDSPVGSGLGASSTLVVAMIKAFDCYLGIGLTAQEIAELAFKIEREDCALAGGRQDQFSAAFGGFNFMKFSEKGTEVEGISVSDEVVSELESSLVLFYTGVSRSSADVIAQQAMNLQSDRSVALQAMHKVKQEAKTMRDLLIAGDFEGIVESMKEGWEQKKMTSAAVSNTHIDGIYSAAIGSGALAGKVSGAGGGGFMWFFTPIARRAAVLDALKSFNGTISNCHFSDKGAQAWKTN